MVVELPRRVAAAPPAAPVVFPWTEAAAALSALSAAAGAIASHREARSAMSAALAEWSGRFRDEFDRADAGLAAAAIDVEDGLVRKAGAIVDGAEAANAAQVRRNDNLPEMAGAG